MLTLDSYRNSTPTNLYGLVTHNPSDSCDLGTKRCRTVYPNGSNHGPRSGKSTDTSRGTLGGT